MPKRVKCCIPGCGNSYKNKGSLRFYRIPKDADVRNTYRLLLRDKNVRIDSDSTRICSAHFESGCKLSRTHLPNIFPWTSGEDQKVGEKRKNLENIASVLKTIKSRSPGPGVHPFDDGVDDDYPYRRVPWRFDELPIYNGRIAGFKTNEELMAYATPLNHTSVVACHVMQDGKSAAINFAHNPTAEQEIRVEYEPTLHIETQLNRDDRFAGYEDDVSNSNNIINQLSVLDNNELSNNQVVKEKPKVKIYKECACQTEVCEEDFQQMAHNLNAVKWENRRLRQELETLKRSLCNM